MGLYQSYRQVFVTNSPSLLAQGKTVDSLAVGQIGILDGKTYTAVTAPTYATNKAIKFVWGTPDVTLGDFGGMPNENEYTKLIKGKYIKGFRVKKAQRGVTPVYTVGWSGGANDTDTLFANAGESKSLFIKLTGTIIDRLYDKQGFVKEFITVPACLDDCGDNCAEVLCPDLAMQLVNQINSDKDFKKFIKAKALIKCDTSPAVTTHTVYNFTLSVNDAGDQTAFGLVQAQFPNEDISIISRSGITTTYGVTETANTAPAAFTGASIAVPDCGSCPSGYTYHAAGSGLQENCTQNSPATIAWLAAGTLTTQDQAYTITLADSVCGTSRLADLQAAYPDYTVSAVSASGSCVHTYSMVVTSDPYATGCAISSIVFPNIQLFEGEAWVPTLGTAYAGNCLCGVQLETAFFNLKTNECSFDSFPYENDIVHIQVSNYNPNFNASPCEGEWVVKQLRQVQYPQGDGAYIQFLEKESKQYDQRFRAYDAATRYAQGYSLQTDPSKFYDQYSLIFETKFYTSGGWSEKYEETFTLEIFVPEGNGVALENAINGYISSAGIDEDKVGLRTIPA